MPEIKSNLSHAIIGNSSIACPRCGNKNFGISKVVFISNNRNVIADETSVSVEQDKQYEMPAIYSHYKNRKQEPGDNNLIFNLKCSNFDCPDTLILFHHSKEGLMIEFADDNTKMFDSEFNIKEKTMDNVTFTNKETKEVITMMRNRVSLAWSINNKEVSSGNSNLLGSYQRKIIKGIPVTGWINSENNKELQLKLFVRKNENLSDPILFWKFRFKENGKWKLSKEENPVHDSDLLVRLFDTWKTSTGDTDIYVSRLV